MGTSSTMSSPAASSSPSIVSTVVQTLKPKLKMKSKKPTLALSPDDFEKENLRVERNACRMKLAAQDVEMKELKDKVKILATRCDLFEKQRNDQAFQSLSVYSTSSLCSTAIHSSCSAYSMPSTVILLPTTGYPKSVGVTDNPNDPT